MIDYSLAFRALEAKTPSMIAGLLEERRERAELLSELTALPESRWLTAIREPRFHHPAFGDTLLERAKVEIPKLPSRGERLAELALFLGCRFEGGDALAAHAAAVLAGALRVKSHWTGAEEMLTVSSSYLAGPPEAWERGYFARSLALLRWEQGRMEEATALLARAREVFRAGGDLLEESVTLGLQGLLWSAQAETRRAVPLLLEARKGLPLDAAPSLAIRVELTAARHLATTVRRQMALALAEEAQGALPSIANESEAAHLRGLLGRALSRLGLKSATHLLDSVRREAVAQKQLPEAALASLALVADRLAHGLPHDGLRLAGDLAQAAACDEGRELALCALSGFVETVEAGAPLRIVEEVASARLAVELQRIGLRVEALPFV